MSTPRDPHPHLPSSDEADPEKVTTPGGVTEDLERHADETGAGAVDDERRAEPPQS
jgi:hypothetical protein